MFKTQTKSKEIEKDRINTILKLSVTAALASLGIILSAVVIFFPNIEFISVSIFLITLLFGMEYGYLSAVSIAVIYEFLIIPIYGTGGFLIFIKITCYLILVLITGLGKRLFVNLSFWELGVLGATFALLYDIITTIFGQIIFLQESFSFEYFFGLLIWGIPFTLSHMIGNFILFSLTKTLIGWIDSAFKLRGIKLLKLTVSDEVSNNIDEERRKTD